MFRKTYTVQQCTWKRWKLSEKHDLWFYHLPGRGGKNIGENHNELMYLKYSSKFQEHFHGNYSVVQEHPLWDIYKNEQMCVADSFTMATAQVVLISLYPWILTVSILICIYIHTYIYTCIYIHIHVYTYTYIYVCVYVYACICMYVHVYMYVCIICMYTYIHIHIYMYVCIQFFFAKFNYFKPKICF